MENSQDTTHVSTFESTDQKTKQSDSLSVVILSFVVLSLLSVPFLMGLHINALGNAEPIRARIAVQEKLFSEDITDKEKAALVPDSWWSIGCLYPLGGLIAALGANTLMNLLGRKSSSYIFILASVIGGVLKLCSYWVHFSILMIGRFFDGIGSAGLMVTSIVLLFELTSKRGASIAKPMIQISVNFGIFVIALVTIKEGLGSHYQYSFIVSIAISIYVFIATLILPESPVWKYEKNHLDDSVKALKKVHGSLYEVYYNEIKEKFVKSESKQDNIGFRQLFGARYRGAIISTIILNAAQQLSGINCIMAFAPTILDQMKVGRSDHYSLIIFASALIGSIIFAPIVSFKPRKKLLIIGHSLMAVCMVVQLFNYHLRGPGIISIVVFSLFVFIFQIAPGPLVWFICIEIFPPNAVSAAQSLGVASNWICNAIVFAIAGLHQDIMIFFGLVNVLISVYLYFFVAETLNRTPTEILDEYEKRFAFFKC